VNANRYSILIIEDNPLDAELVQQRLRAAGYSFEATVVDSRASFDSAFSRQSFDLVLADYSLPDFDGLTGLDIVRSRFARLPFIFVSGVLGEDVAVETLLRGATDYVLKQKLDRLGPAVKRALSEYAEYQSRQRAEQDLRKIEERFKRLTNSLPAMVWTCDNEGQLTFVNSQWKRCIGDADTWFDSKILHPSDVAKCCQAWKDAQDIGKPFELDCRFRMMSDGVYHWHLVRAIPLGPAEGPKEWVGTCTDIEQQKLRDEELKTAERLALTGRMASVIAHEINNPLEALTNILFLVRSNATSPEEAASYLNDAQHELLRISAITKQTLAWSRQEGSVIETPMYELVEDTLKLFTGKVRNKSIQLNKRLDNSLIVRVVPGEICQVLANLFSNAIDAVQLNGAIDVILEQDEDPSNVRLSVEDNGKGIDPDQMQNLFRPFQTTKGNLGNGLGLYVSKGIVDRHSGELRIHSEVFVGTTVTVVLPRAASPRDEQNLERDLWMSHT